jgi:hypothetical protein
MIPGKRQLERKVRRLERSAAQPAAVLTEDYRAMLLDRLADIRSKAEPSPPLPAVRAREIESQFLERVASYRS